MSIHTTTHRQPLTTARVNGHPVLIRQATRAEEAGVVTVGLTVTLSLDHAAVALYGYDASPAELADPERVRALVADAVLNGGCLQLDLDRADTAALADPAPVPGSERAEQAAHWAACRQGAAAVFASAPQWGRVVVGRGVLR